MTDRVRRALVIQHLEPEGPYAIADALRRAGSAVDVVRTDRQQAVPEDLSGYDSLVVMGGPMSATSDAGFPTRLDELRLLRRAIEQQIPTLGVCLGAQLLALAAGGAVLVGDDLEVGWGPIELLPVATNDPLFADTPARLTVLHWHGETYTLPSHAVALARSARYEQQAFRVGANAWGLQFHLEVDIAAVTAFVDSFLEDTARAAGGRSGLVGKASVTLDALAPHRDRILDRFARLAVDAE